VLKFRRLAGFPEERDRQGQTVDAREFSAATENKDAISKGKGGAVE